MIGVNHRNELLVLLALEARDATSTPESNAKSLLSAAFEKLEYATGRSFEPAERRELLKTLGTVPGPGSRIEWAEGILKDAGGILGVNVPQLLQRVRRGMERAVLAAPEAKIAPEGNAQSVRVKVCGIRDEPSVLATLSAAHQSGSDNLIMGFLLGLTHASKEKLSDSEGAKLIAFARRMSAALAQPAELACVTHMTSADELIGMIQRIETAALAELGEAAKKLSDEGTANALLERPLLGMIQIHDDMPLSEIDRVRAALPDRQIIKGLHVPKKGEPVSLEDLVERAVALARSPSIDGILLDSASLETDQIGGTGLVNDWDVARAIIQAVHEQTKKTVALAGGLSPDNVAEAVAYTHPDVVDANSGFRFDRKGGSWRSVDPDRTAPKNVFDVLTVLDEVEKATTGV